LRLGKGPSLAPSQREFLLERYLRPQPRLVLAPALAHARAAMDVSDGLVGDLAKMLRASGVGGTLDLREVPFSPAAQAWFKANAGGIEIAATGGDDYEVLAAVPPEKAQAFEAAAAVPVRRIGVVREGAFEVLGLEGAPARFARSAYSHF
jgi:thiamine-monophosphate kinase